MRINKLRKFYRRTTFIVDTLIKFLWLVLLIKWLFVDPMFVK